MKNYIALPVILSLTIFFTGCTYPEEQPYQKNIVQESSESTTENESSKASIDYFIGEWHCSRENSVNDMDITLTFTKKYESGVAFTRNMIDPSGGNAGSIVSGVAYVFENSREIKVSYLKGNGYILATDDNLYEYFDSGKCNTFEKIK